MKALAGGIAALGMWLVAGSQPAERISTVPDTRENLYALTLDALADEVRAAPEELNELIAEYCVRCHSEPRMSGNLDLEGFDVAEAHENAQIAERMIVKLRAEMMPPPGGRRGPYTISQAGSAIQS